MEIHPYHPRQVLRRPTAFQASDAQMDPLDDPSNMAIAEYHYDQVDSVRKLMKTTLTAYLRAVADQENFYWDLAGDGTWANPSEGSLNAVVDETVDQHLHTVLFLAERLLKANTEPMYTVGISLPKSPVQEPQDTDIPAGVEAFTSRARPSSPRLYPKGHLSRRTHFWAAQTKEDPQARSLVAEHYDQVLRTARSMARRYGLPESLSEDLETVALNDLERTAKAFDPSRGAKFSTYLLGNLIPNLRKAAVRLSRRRGSLPEGGLENLPAPGDHSRGPEDKDLRKSLQDLVKRLPPTEKAVVERHNGLSGDEPETLQAIAVDMGIPAASARTIYARALGRLRRSMESLGVDGEALMSAKMCRTE